MNSASDVSTVLFTDALSERLSLRLSDGRRADGRDLDWMLHVNPNLEECELLVVFNPLDHAVTKSLNVPLYYTGLDRSMRMQTGIGASSASPPASAELQRDFSFEVTVTEPVGGMSRVSFLRP